MTGGRRRRELVELMEDGPTYPKWVPPPPLPFELEATRAMEEWGRAMELRERVDDLLRPRGLTFLQWRVIHVTGLLMRETGDMVSQLDIRRRAFLSAGTASKQMFALAARGWLDYGPDYYGVAYRICTTDKAALMLAETRPLVVSLADRA